VLGTLILIGVIGAMLPLFLPKLLGYEVYNIVSPSMEPAIPMGSMVLVEQVDPVEVERGDVIAFRRGGVVVTHRVTQNRVVEGEFMTKGDANAEEDASPVPYDNLVGRVKTHVPVLGQLMAYLTTALGKVYLLCLIACGVMFHVLAGRLRQRAAERSGRTAEIPGTPPSDGRARRGR
jgi:signal peptidase I